MSQRKSYNLSLQKKKNKIVLTPIVERCEREGTYVSDVVVDYVERAVAYEQSKGLNKALNTYDLIKNTLSREFEEGTEEYQKRVEGVMRSVITIDGESLAQFLSDPDGFSNEAAASISMSASRPASVPAQSPAPVREESYVEERTPTAEPVINTTQDDEQVEIERQAEVRRKEREKARREREAQREADMKKEAEKSQNDDSVDGEEDGEIVLNEYALFNE